MYLTQLYNVFNYRNCRKVASTEKYRSKRFTLYSRIVINWILVKYVAPKEADDRQKYSQTLARKKRSSNTILLNQKLQFNNVTV